MATDKTKEQEVVVGQFRRVLDHLLLDLNQTGPELVLGDVTLKFLPKPPVTALAILIGSTSQIDGMIGYLKATLLPGQEEDLDKILKLVDVEGLGEILNTLTEAYTSFPETS